MKTYILLIILGLCTTLKVQAQDNFLGFWENEDKTQIIEIYKSDSSYYGKIAHLKKTDSKEQVILIQMKKRDDKVLYGGTYFDENLNKEYEVKLKLKNKDTIKIIGFYGFLNKRMNLSRVPVVALSLN